MRRGEKWAVGIKKSFWSKPSSILQCFLHRCSSMTISCHVHVQRFEPVIPFFFFLTEMASLKINPNPPFTLTNCIQCRLCTKGAGCLSAACSLQTAREVMSRCTWAFKKILLCFLLRRSIPTPSPAYLPLLWEMAKISACFIFP